MLPSDPTSSHGETKHAALTLFDSLSSSIGKFTVNGILAAMSSPDLKASASSSGAVKIPMPFVKIRDFVHGTSGSGIAGRVNPEACGAKLLQFLPFSERAFLVYVADFIEGLLLGGRMPQEQKDVLHPFADELRFLSFVDAVCDTNRCPSADVIAATEEMRLLGMSMSHESKF